MQYSSHYLFISLIILALLSCQKTMDTPTSINNDLVFSFANPLTIPTNLGIGGFPIFDLSQITDELVYIGIFSEPVLVVDGKIANEDALLWYWNSGVSDKTQILYEDGVLQNSLFSLSNFACLKDEQFYWAGWAWEETGRKVNKSTRLFSLQLDKDYGAFLEYVDFQIIEDENQDGFINSGENITINIALFNSANEAIEDGLVTVFYQDNIILAEKTFDILTIKDIAGLPINFTVPERIDFGEEIPLVIQLKYNQCQVQNQSIQLKISGLEVCLSTVTLESINYLPDLIYWDPVLLPVNWDPDTYFIIEQEDVANLYRSKTLNDRNIQLLPQSWPVISPCQTLSLNKKYTIIVFDEDFFDTDDFIGEISFTPSDYLKEQPKTITIGNQQINMSIELFWQ